MTTLPTYYISHGGGPWPWLPSMRRHFGVLEKSLTDMVASWQTPPKAILMISGHWEGDKVGIMSAQNPPMIYDYTGFPKEMYEITYPAPGAPDVALRIQELLTSAGIASEMNDAQGFDHGTFAPLEIMYPQADVPVIQISMLASYDPAAHYAIGRALAPLRDEGIMIIGSGLSYHNLGFMNPQAAQPSAAFDAWLQDTLALQGEERLARLATWEAAPSARICHPREDHLVPLFVALGAAQDAATEVIYHQNDLMGGITASGFRFG